MPKATPQITSPPDTPPPSAPAPSVLELGRMILAVDRRNAAMDVHCLRATDRKNGMYREMNRLSARRDALSDVAATLPAQTLEDVAVHLTIAFCLIDEMTANETDMARAKQTFRALRQILCRCLPPRHRRGRSGSG